LTVQEAFDHRIADMAPWPDGSPVSLRGTVKRIFSGPDGQPEIKTGQKGDRTWKSQAFILEQDDGQSLRVTWWMGDDDRPLYGGEAVTIGQYTPTGKQGGAAK